jgi:hypothetical protein
MQCRAHRTAGAGQPGATSVCESRLRAGPDRPDFWQRPHVQRHHHLDSPRGAEGSERGQLRIEHVHLARSISVNISAPQAGVQDAADSGSGGVATLCTRFIFTKKSPASVENLYTSLPFQRESRKSMRETCLCTARSVGRQGVPLSNSIMATRSDLFSAAHSLQSFDDGVSILCRRKVLHHALSFKNCAREGAPSISLSQSGLRTAQPLGTEVLDAGHTPARGVGLVIFW